MGDKKKEGGQRDRPNGKEAARQGESESESHEACMCRSPYNPTVTVVQITLNGSLEGLVRSFLSTSRPLAPRAPFLVVDGGWNHH
ncbi:hypothetical protein LB504_001869 [Fusarium proliferatum]|nr:hypothetical protein LB504_001869 [Fusarium proliferatum]